MATDYVMFVHGVNTRDIRENPKYAEGLITKLKERKTNNQRQLIPVPLYWGNVNQEAEEQLLKTMESSPKWDKMWFREFRSHQLLQFIGDAALYISRFIGSNVVKQLKTDGLGVIKNVQPDDRLHLVTHSWGTVILLDVLFAPRWNYENVPGHEDVMDIRDKFFGITGVSNTGQRTDTTHKGIILDSIHTMGSPIPFFNLTNITGSSSDISDNLQKLLTNLYHKTGKSLPWRNYIHPGDPVAYPIKELMQDLIKGTDSNCLDIDDILTGEAGLLDIILDPFSQSTLALLHGGEAHGSYWNSDRVADKISHYLQ
ncbi:hypothetical protein NIES2100_03280 [Calothrix sp. NIES-2100]|uniref:hypothetical protein n=1 Tax=Calothrix sp. NIES-2100 TaxID=1954172 RepID=UPI000B5DC97E|nr:hypothetical protein NIES2100_03280 [Calothrix sp. NIES-2100]